MSNTLTEAIRVRLTVEQRNQLELLAARFDRPLGYVIRRAIREFLEREEKETAS
jgi:predicted transcriptional regulator